MQTMMELSYGKALILDFIAGVAIQTLVLPGVAFAQGNPPGPASAPIPSYVFLAILVALGGLLLITAALALAVIGIALILKKKPAVKEQESAAPSEPEMPIHIEAELSFPTGDPYDSDPDTIATEVFVRAESLPPEEVETVDDLPGVLKAQRKTE